RSSGSSAVTRPPDERTQCDSSKRTGPRLDNTIKRLLGSASSTSWLGLDHGVRCSNCRGSPCVLLVMLQRAGTPPAHILPTSCFFGKVTHDLCRSRTSDESDGSVFAPRTS